MKLQDLKFFLLALSAVSLLSCTVKSQTKVSDLVYHNLIKDIMSRDTVIPEWRNKLIKARVQNGQITKEDSIKYNQVIKASKLLLYNKKTNSLAKKSFAIDIEEEGFLVNYLSKKIVQRLINTFPENSFHDDSLSIKNIELINDLPKWQDYHKFSSPILIEENRFILYHYKSTERFNFKYGVVIFSLNNNTYKVEKELTLKQVIL